MVLVEHGGDAVKAKAVKAELVEVEAQVGEEEALDFPAAIVEEAAVPEGVEAAGAVVEVAVVGAVKAVQAVKD